MSSAPQDEADIAADMRHLRALNDIANSVVEYSDAEAVDIVVERLGTVLDPAMLAALLAAAERHPDKLSDIARRSILRVALKAIRHEGNN